MYSQSYRYDNVYKYYDNLEINSCLLAGLGELELIPVWLKTRYPNLILDIIEIDKNKTSENFKVLYEDVFTFTPYLNYDLIIFDIWYVRDQNLLSEIKVLKEKYFPYLNKSGFMSLPMIDMHTIYSYVDLQKERDYIDRRYT